jgi:hypothetical protein
MLKKLSDSDKNRLVCDFQREVESVISLGIVIPGKESYQARARQLIQDYTRDLACDLFDTEFVLSVAYAGLERLARDIAHDSHDRLVHNCACCHALMQDQKA